MRHLIYAIFTTFSVFVIGFWLTLEPEKVSYLEKGKITTTTPTCVQMFYAIDKYSEQYQIPKSYAYALAYYETRYTGPFQWNYDPSQTSTVGALGPLQIMYATAKTVFPDEKFSKERLRDDIDFNVHCGMKLLRQMYDRIGNWEKVFGCYSTGKILVNDYARNVVRYQIKWTK